MKVGKTTPEWVPPSPLPKPAMEPDHEGREDLPPLAIQVERANCPQWSPTMKVGKTQQAP